MENFVIRLANEQKKCGNDVSIMALRKGELEDIAKSKGISTFLIQKDNKIDRLITAAYFIRKFNPDIVNAHNSTTLKFAALSSRFSQAKVVLTNHGQGANSPVDPNQREWKTIDAIVAVSEAVLQQMESPELSDKIQVITNGIQFERANRTKENVRSSLDISQKRVVAIIVARIDDFKGHDSLLKAINILKKRSVELTVLVVGDGSQRVNRENLARELLLDSSIVKFLGFRTDIPDLLAASDFFVLPSLTEGLPLSILEAMSHGLPTVATKVGGIPELITSSKQGFLVPVDAPEALADAMQLLTQDADLRKKMSIAAVDRVKSDFSFENMVDKYNKLYCEIKK